jgi:predicted phosphodiesterase
MIVKDLGEIDGDMLLFGGPYSNLQATEALLIEAAHLGIDAEHMICTGDVVAYCGDPSATVDLIMDSGIPVVAGNCEKQLAANALDCGCGFETGTTCDLLSAGWYAHATAEVTEKHRNYMAQCPDIIVFTRGGQRYAVIHGGVTDNARFIWSASETVVFEEERAAIEALVGKIDAVVAGHSGIAFEKDVAGIKWINAGVIGMPPHDGEADVRFAILSQGKAEIRRLSYDVDAAVARMKEVGLVQGYHAALASGIWPSEDVLPTSLRR